MAAEFLLASVGYELFGEVVSHRLPYLMLCNSPHANIYGLSDEFTFFVC